MVDWDETVGWDEVAGDVVSHVAAEALEGEVEKDQDVSGTVHPVLDPDEETRMLSPLRMARADLNSSFVPT